jgi:hypothetical protein
VTGFAELFAKTHDVRVIAPTQASAAPPGLSP